MKGRTIGASNGADTQVGPYVPGVGADIRVGQSARLRAGRRDVLDRARLKV